MLATTTCLRPAIREAGSSPTPNARLRRRHLSTTCSVQLAKMKWVTIKKAAELSGYSVKAIEAKRANGVWLEGVVWIKAPDGRILISPDAIDEWVEGIVRLPDSKAPVGPNVGRKKP
jgi:hypothetical protein